MTSAAFDAGAHAALLTKVASLDGTVHDVVTSALKTRMPEGQEPAPSDELDTLLPDDGALEALVGGLEDNFDVSLGDDVVFDLFADGTVADLESAIVDGLVEKTAAFDSHAYYMRNRQRRRQQARAYRQRNMHQLRRKAKIYRKQVARGARRQRRRIGTAGGGYSFIPR